MTETSTEGQSRLTKTHKFSIAGVAAVGAAALAFSLVPGNASAESSKTLDASNAALSTQTKVLAASVQQQQEDADKAAKEAAQVAAAKAKDAKAAKAKADAKAKSDAAAKAKADAAAKAKADAAAAAKKRSAEAAASRAAARQPVYANNLDGWINHALAIMKEKGIPGSYDGLYRNIIRESGGNPSAINNYDINAQNGTPSIGLLQVIQPTFDTYHVAGTANDLYDPVANITAAANYAAATYGSIDNVNGAY
ncbi:transglycosylase SLT domain-containing protein [Streptomyces sp. NPDC050738]|uniref:transglycosylase SLT domain-containing protein n=1 Tax=Streptomyces sp. NPDC050738 TaxID=3154744 RepID=UPI00341BA7AB